MSQHTPSAGPGTPTHAATAVGAPDSAEQEDAASTRRRRLVSGATLVVGAMVLAWSLRISAGDELFYPATILLATIWVVGAGLSGPMPLGAGHAVGERGTRHVITSALVTGLLLLAVFIAGAVVVSQIPPLATPVQQLLDHARHGSLIVVALITAVNGLSEELFFRGALFAALPRRHQIAGTTIIYTLVTAMSGIPLLVLAALLLGVVVALQRRTTGGLLAPTITHLTWSLGMLFLLGPTLSTAARLLG